MLDLTLTNITNPTVELPPPEVEKAICELKNNKNPGFDGVVAELTKMIRFKSHLAFIGYVRLFGTRRNG